MGFVHLPYVKSCAPASILKPTVMPQRLLIVLLFFHLYSDAQNNLSQSIRHSQYSYFYRISDEDAAKLYRSKPWRSVEKYLYNKTDSFPTASKQLKKPAPGNYLLVSASNNMLRYELMSFGDIHCKFVNNYQDLALFIHRKDGSIITDARVYLGKKQIAFDASTNTYRINNRKRGGTIKVIHNGSSWYFPTIRTRSTRQNVLAKLSYYPAKYFEKILRLFGPVKSYNYQYFQNSTPYEQKFTGFMVFNKPKYKPGDTVKLKAFITGKHGRRISKPLILRLTDNYFGVDTIVASLHPYRKGAYEYQFVLNDTLDLDLDEEYLLTLEEKRSRKYDLDDYDGELEEDEYARKRKVVMRGKFYYEEYELKKTSFSVRSSKNEHHRGEQVSLFLKATDENNLPVMDGRANILIRPDNNPRFLADKLFMPDTLWYHSQVMDAVGETRIDIPDSLFPEAVFSYTINCEFRTSDNEAQTQNLIQHFDGTAAKLEFTPGRDSLRIQQLRTGRQEQAMAAITALNTQRDTVLYERIMLPATIRIHPFVKYYHIQTADCIDEFVNAAPVLPISSNRTKDSVFVSVTNTNKIFFWYSIFAGSKIIKRGYTDSLYYAGRAVSSGKYFVTLQYQYGDQMQSNTVSIPYQNKLLNVEWEAPEAIYPGQELTIGLTVRNSNGEPEPDADITAYSFTRKFEDVQAPFIPYFGKKHLKGKLKHRFFQHSSYKLKDSIYLGWERWSREMNLDSIEYYKFLFTKNIYINREPSPAAITQIAPFVVYKGVVEPVHMLYIDNVPVFFSQADQLSRYSFNIYPGKHSLRLRTAKKMIYLDSITIQPWCKTFIGINADTSNKMVRIEKMPDTLTKHEQLLWSRYLILLENKFGEHMAHIKQQSRYFLLNQPGVLRSQQYRPLIGPLNSSIAELSVKKEFNQDFVPEGGYIFDISKGLVKQKQLPQGRILFQRLYNFYYKLDFSDYVLTGTEIDSLWQNFLDNRSANEDLFYNARVSAFGNGRLKIAIPQPDVFVKNIILFRYDEPDFARIYKGLSRDLGFLRPGMYRVFFLLKADKYFIADSVAIRKNGINFYRLDNMILHEKDSVSARITSIVESLDRGRFGEAGSDMQKIKEAFNERYVEPEGFPFMASGRIVDAKGNPLPGAQISISGTKLGVASDNSGYFKINIPANTILVFRAVGYDEQGVEVSGNTEHLLIKMKESSNAMQEVVVVGYGTTRKRDLTGAVSTVKSQLSGLAPGVAVQIRGLRSSGNNTKPLIILDGLPYEGDLRNLDTSLFNLQVYTFAQAQALYGSRADGGVIVITTKKAGLANTNFELPPQGNFLRKNFSDYAFWQPRLRTDKNGRASFKTVFPDDITNWRSFAIAMGNRKQSGFSEMNIRSFKLLSGSINLPQFAISGDSINIIGKIMNYRQDTVEVKRSFVVNGENREEGLIVLRNAHVDSFSVNVKGPDSLSVKYTIEKPGNYFDGEERKIPVFRPGVLETRGIFASLEKDTSFSLSIDTSLGKLTIYAEASLLPVLLDEMDKIRNYEYLCNEQLASKLKSLLMEKRVCSYLKKEFRHEPAINTIISLLNKNKSGVLWGWWPGNEVSVWISMHVVEALLMAEQAGYFTSLNKKMVIDFLILNLEHYYSVDRIACLSILNSMKATIDHKRYLHNISSNKRPISLYEHLRFVKLQQDLGIEVNTDSIIKLHHRTMFGNMYWGEDGYRFFDNAVQNTLLMYRIIRASGKNVELLSRIRNYFLEKRKDGKWRNTYESSLILETILPDLIKGDVLPRPASLTVKGLDSVHVSHFPYTLVATGVKEISITKHGQMPLYFTAFQQSWNADPKMVAGEFKVSSLFESNGNRTENLKAGQAAVLKVEIEVKADAEYVMIEIPIPAGCSYKDKEQPKIHNEVHREYAKNKVSIFCSRLLTGSYTFSVSLMPRYTGRYHLNPAKAEMMYFPVFYGREGMKKVDVY
jgi:hypothetical protein